MYDCTSFWQAMERKSLSQKDKAQHSRYIERLHHEEDLIKVSLTITIPYYTFAFLS